MQTVIWRTNKKETQKNKYWLSNIWFKQIGSGPDQANFLINSSDKTEKLLQISN